MVLVWMLVGAGVMPGRWLLSNNHIPEAITKFEGVDTFNIQNMFVSLSVLSQGLL